MKKLTKTQSGLIAIGIYFFLLILILIYFSSDRPQEQEVKINNGTVVSVDVGSGVAPSTRGVQTPIPNGAMVDTGMLRSSRVIPRPDNSVYREMDSDRGIFQSVQDMVSSSQPPVESSVVEKVVESTPKVTPKEPTKVKVQEEPSKNLFDKVQTKEPVTQKKEESKSKYDESPDFEPSIRPRQESGSSSAVDKINQSREQSVASNALAGANSSGGSNGDSNFGEYVQSIKVKLSALPLSQGCNNGENATIRFTIYNSGKFDFAILNSSANPECQKELVASLNQLKRMGGFKSHDSNSPHTGNVNYHFN